MRSMERVRYRCEILTPMFLHGSNNRELVLRSVAIKSKMRFWWRALTDLDGLNLLEKEEALFGGIGFENRNVKIPQSRAPFDLLLYPERTLRKGNRYLLPHRGQASVEAYLESSNNCRNYIWVEIVLRKNNTPGVLAFYENLFEMVSVLDGIGNRSRRGAGSFAIVEKERNGEDASKDLTLFAENGEDAEQVCHWIKERMKVVAGYGMKPEAVVALAVNQDKDGHWRVTSEWNVKKSWNNQMVKMRRSTVTPVNASGDKVYELIAEATHEARPLDDDRRPEYIPFKAKARMAADVALGTVRQKTRLSSPVIVSVARFGSQKYMVISCLSFAYRDFDLYDVSGRLISRRDFRQQDYERLVMNKLKNVQKMFETIVFNKF